MTFLRNFLILIGLLAATWLAGLGVFVGKIEAIEQVPPPETETDAIVVLTGGSERVSTGFELLNAHKAQKLLISGVHKGLKLDHLPASPPVTKELRACCVVLGHEAETTFGNAVEAHNWMETNGFRTLRLVTANYHMPRSLMVFRAEMPQFDIIAHPVDPDNVKLDSWWMRPGTASLLVTEYDKYLLATLRLMLGPV